MGLTAVCTNVCIFTGKAVSFLFVVISTMFINSELFNSFRGFYLPCLKHFYISYVQTHNYFSRDQSQPWSTQPHFYSRNLFDYIAL